MNIRGYNLLFITVVWDLALTNGGWDCAIDAPCLCENNIINCKQRRLTAVPPITPSADQYEELTLAGNRIASLGGMPFKGLKIKKLDLSENPITSIGNSSFHGLETSLRELRLEVAGMRSLPMFAFNQLRVLERVWLKGFNLKVLPSFTFTIPTLFDVSLINCGITQVDNNAFEGIKSSLTSLNLNSNKQLNSIPTEALSKMSKLRKLYVVQTGQKSLPNDVFRGLHSLQDVDLSHNEINAISDKAFDSVKDTLQLLLLHINALTGGETLRPLAELSKLHQLNLATNQIISLPTGLFQKMGNLAFLNLYDNQLSSLNRDTLVGLQHTIHTLLVGDNRIKEVESDTFLHFTELTELHLDNMPLDGVLSPTVFRGLEDTLQILYLDKTSVIDSVWSAVDRLGKLRVLSLENNKLTRIPDNALLRMTSLTTLNVGGNKVKSLSREALRGPEKSLTMLDLHDNLLRTLDKCVLFGFENLQQISLSGNALHCDCKLTWLKAWIAERYDSFLAGLVSWRCASPPRHSGKLFRNINATKLTCDSSSPPTEVTCTEPTPPVTLTVSVDVRPTSLPPDNLKIRITEAGLTTLRIEWTVPASLLPSLSGFMLEYRKRRGSDLSRSNPIHNSLQQYTIGNLDSSTSYLVCLVLLNLDGSQVSHSDYCTEGNTTVGQVAGGRDGKAKTDSGNVGVILGAVVGVLVVTACICIVAFFVIRRKQKKSHTYDKPDTSLDMSSGFPSREELPHFGYGSKRFTKSKSRTSVDMAEDTTGAHGIHHTDTLGGPMSGFSVEERDKILNMMTNSGSMPRYVPELPPRNLPPKHRKTAQDEVDNPDDHVYMEINYI